MKEVFQRGKPLLHEHVFKKVRCVMLYFRCSNLVNCKCYSCTDIKYSFKTDFLLFKKWRQARKYPMDQHQKDANGTTFNSIALIESVPETGMLYRLVVAVPFC
jgi:hypothetical protein